MGTEWDEEVIQYDEMIADLLKSIIRVCLTIFMFTYRTTFIT